MSPKKPSVLLITLCLRKIKAYEYFLNPKSSNEPLKMQLPKYYEVPVSTKPTSKIKLNRQHKNNGFQEIFAMLLKLHI
jgi:hypothetical protein